MIKSILTLVYLGMNAWQDIKKKEILLWTVLFYSVTGMILKVLETEEFVLFIKNLGMVILVFLLAVMFCYWTKGAIGMGDVLILTSMGIVLGFKEMMLIFITSLLLAAVYSGIMMVLGKAGRKTEIPFVPFLFGGFAGGLWIW